MKKVILLFCLLFTVQLFAADIDDLKLTSRQNGGKVVVEPKDSGGTKVIILEADGQNATLTIPSGVTLKVNSVENSSGGVPPGMVPIGGMVPIVKIGTGVNQWQPPASGVIKDGFMLADGNGTIPSGPLAGEAVPQMDSMVRGVTTFAGATGGGGQDSVTPSGTFSGNAVTISSTFFRNETVSLNSHQHIGTGGVVANVLRLNRAFGSSTATYANSYGTVIAKTDANNSGTWYKTSSETPTMNSGDDNKNEWAASGSYTPSGSFTGDSQTNIPSYKNVVWVVRVL